MNNVQDMSGQPTEPPRQALLLEDAAKDASVYIDALRKRLQRGLEDGYKANDGKWRVYVNPDWTVQSVPGSDRTTSSRILDQLLDQVRTRVADKDKTIDVLAEQIDRKDEQLAAQADVIRDLIGKLPGQGSEVVELRKKLDSQGAIVKRAYRVLQDQLKAEVA